MWGVAVEFDIFSSFGCEVEGDLYLSDGVIFKYASTDGFLREAIYCSGSGVYLGSRKFWCFM